jgi:hypothetical protein
MMRSSLSKLGGGILTDLHTQVKQGAVADSQLSGLIQDSLHRVDNMAAYLKNAYAMAQVIQARQVGSRG